MRKMRPNLQKTYYGPSQTIPGQSLIPAELLKRHLAGTLPDIGKNPLYTHDENGKQISEDLSHLELHEMHDLARALRDEYDKRTAQENNESKEQERLRIIEEYKAEHAKTQGAQQPAPPDPEKGFSPNRRDSEKTPGTARVSRKGDGAAGSSEKSDA